MSGFDNLPKGIQDEVQARIFRYEIEADEDDRRMFTTFGYNRGRMPALFVWLFAPIVVAGLTIIGLAGFYPESISATSLLWWIIIPPFALLPVTPFVFLKVRYAMRALGIIIAILVVMVLVFAMFNAIMRAIL